MIRNLRTLGMGFARKSKKSQMDSESDVDTSQVQEIIKPRFEVQIQEKYHQRSARLYQKYLQSRQKATLTLDDYQVHFAVIIERLPIFLPYNTARFEYYKNWLRVRKNTKRNVEMPKEFKMESLQKLSDQGDRENPDNFPSHHQEISRSQVIEYRQNSRYWKYTDPSITDPKSIQTYSSDNVYFIVKDGDGKWKFPTRCLRQKQSQKDFFFNISNQLFTSVEEPECFFSLKKPVLCLNWEDDTLLRGKGVREYFFKGINIKGTAALPNQMYEDFAWVPKPFLHEYFEEDYYKKVIRSVTHLL